MYYFKSLFLLIATKISVTTKILIFFEVFVTLLIPLFLFLKRNYSSTYCTQIFTITYYHIQMNSLFLKNILGQSNQISFSRSYVS